MASLGILLSCLFLVLLCTPVNSFGLHNLRLPIAPGISYVNYNRRRLHRQPTFTIALPPTAGVQSGTQDGQIHFPGKRPATKRTDLKIEDSWDGTPYDEQDCSPPFGKIQFGGQCHKILSQGPCPDNFWTILDQSGIPECAMRRCPLGQLHLHGVCVSANSRNMCPRNEIPYVEYSGQAYCDCQPSFIYLSKPGRCVQEHAQGTCPYGQYIEVDVNEDIACVVNPCKTDTQVLNPIEKRCYRKAYIGRCKEEDGSILTFKENGDALCSSTTTRNIFEVPALNSCPTGSRRDHSNRCRETFRIQRRNPFSFRVPSQYTISAELGSCPPGYIKYPNNSCQKANSLFGR